MNLNLDYVHVEFCKEVKIEPSIWLTLRSIIGFKPGTTLDPNETSIYIETQAYKFLLDC